MGRIKTKFIKRTVRNLMVLYTNRFSDKFDENKQALVDVTEISSKKLRNVVAGYLTTVVRQSKKSQF